jgi:mannose-6-phosphate isomerase-like protein (cupin superfamily)
MLDNDIPEDKKVIKPWGSEYTIYKNLNTSMKLLRIETGKSTSLHCHPIKKTGFILIKGQVDVDLGFYNTKKLTAPSRLMIRPGLFHATKNNSKNYAVIFEVETPIDKDDLVRFKDEYGRENLPYEGTNSMENLTNKDPVFIEPNMNETKNYIVEGVKVFLTKTDNIKNLKNREKNEIFVILDGGLKSINNLLVLSPGDIVGSETIEKLIEVFEINKYITFLSIK